MLEAEPSSADQNAGPGSARGGAMSQFPGRPDPGQVPGADPAVTVLTAEARELIDGQYADRPHLRPHH